MTANPYSYLALAAILFSIGLFGVLSRRNAIVMLMSLELMAAAVNINLVAFSRYLAGFLPPGAAAGSAAAPAVTGQLFSFFVMVVAAAEIGLGLAIVLAIYRSRDTIDVDKITLMRW